MATKPALVHSDLLAPLRAGLEAEGLVAVASDKRSQTYNRAYLSVMPAGLSKKRVGTVEAYLKPHEALVYVVTRPRVDADYDTMEVRRPSDVVAFLLRRVRKYTGTVSIVFGKGLPSDEAVLRSLEEAITLRIRAFLAAQAPDGQPSPEVRTHLEGGF